MARKSKKSTIEGRPPLDQSIDLADFNNYYFYKEELVDFCRKHGLPASGPKEELLKTVEYFLRTGKKPVSSKAKRPAKKPERSGPLTPDTKVTSAFRCNQETRDFFKSLIGPHFHFTAYLQQWRRANVDKGITYGDLAEEWKAEYERRKNPNHVPKLKKTWEYNRFTRDFHKDPVNNGKGIGAAAEAWNKIKTNRGERTYEAYKKLYLK